MDRRRPPRWFQHVIVLLPCFIFFFNFGSATGVIRVQRKYSDKTHVIDLRAHDARRHGRLLSTAADGAVDLPLGGMGVPTDTGLYYARIGIGTPSKPYHVQVDTGSDILWVNCASCKNCPKKSDLGIELSFYELDNSTSGSLLSCADNFCTSTYGGEFPDCAHALPCHYTLSYGDGSTTSGYFVKDYVQYNQVSDDHKTEIANAMVAFGCGFDISGDLGSSSEAVDGILGFGPSNSSMISQLASAGKVRKIFSHCLDTKKGGGIFSIGEVDKPKVKSTPLVPDMPHYNVILKAIQVGAAFLKIPSDIFETGEKKGTIIDSGTTLAYLPDQAFKPMMSAIFSYQPGLIFETIQGFICFKFFGSVDDGFPIVTLHFEDSLELSVYPHDYFFTVGEGFWCTGFQNSGAQSDDGHEMILLGDMVLANKLVVYDLENQTVGWTDYDCASSVQIHDGNTETVYSVDSHNLSSFSAGRRIDTEIFVSFLLAAYLMLIFFS